MQKPRKSDSLFWKKNWTCQQRGIFNLLAVKVFFVKWQFCFLSLVSHSIFSINSFQGQVGALALRELTMWLRSTSKHLYMSAMLGVNTSEHRKGNALNPVGRPVVSTEQFQRTVKVRWQVGDKEYSRKSKPIYNPRSKGVR